MAEPDVFYHREDQWQKPVLSRPGERPDPFLRHIVMRLPGERQGGVRLRVPVPPRRQGKPGSGVGGGEKGGNYGRPGWCCLTKPGLVSSPAPNVNPSTQ